MSTNKSKVGRKTTYFTAPDGTEMVGLQHAGGIKSVQLPKAVYDQLSAQGTSREAIANYARDNYYGQYNNTQTNSEASSAEKQYLSSQANKGGGLGGALGNVANFVLPHLGAVGGFANGLIQGQGFSGALKGGLKSGIETAAAIAAPQILGSFGGSLTNNALGRTLGLAEQFGPTAPAGIGGSSGGFLSSIGNSLGSLLGGGSSGTSSGGILSGLGRALGGSGSTGVLGSGIGANNLLSAGANLYSGIQGTQAAKDIASAQSAANNKALALQSKVYGDTTTNLKPFLTSGTAANSRLADLQGISGNTGADGYGTLGAAFNPGDLTQDPGYQFNLQQGTNALNRSLGAQGNLFSGKALKAAQTFGQGLADTTYNDAFNRYQQQQQQQYNMLSGQAQNGQNAAALQGSTGQNYANQASSLYGNQGDITGSSIASQNNTINQSLANALGTNVGGFTGSNQTIIIGYDGNGRPIYGRA